MTNQPSLPGLGTMLGAVYYNLEDSYKVTIVEYRLVEGQPEYTGRSWIKDTRTLPASDWLKELELRLAPPN